MFTILTPTYNRAYILKNAFDSLCRQSNLDFEWIIVDDGSSDGTEELVKGWQEKRLEFPLYYHKRENGGKHRAINYGVLLASTDYILILDSDDYLTDDASEQIHRWIKSIEGMTGFAGVSGLKGNEIGIVGGGSKGEYIDATNLEREKFGLKGDKAEIYKTEILKKYPFPEFRGENFLRESASWDRIAKDGYRIRWFNRVIYVCEYLPDGLTYNAGIELYAKNFQGFTYCTRLYLETHTLFRALLKIGHYACVAKKTNRTDSEICILLGVTKMKLQIAKIMFWLKEKAKLVRKWF